MKRSVAVLFVLSGFLAGILMGEIGVGFLIFACVSLGVAVISLLLSRTQRWRMVLLFLLSGVIVGYARFYLLLPHFGKGDMASYVGLKIDFVAVVADEPDIRQDYQNLILEGKTLLQPKEVSISGKVIAKVSRYPNYHYGDVVKVRCALEVPPRFDTFNYADYLARFDIFAVCRNPFIQFQGATNEGNFFWRLIFGLKSIFVTQIERLWGEPNGSIVAGLLFGLRRTIPQNILDDFNTAGLTHILAISGFNVTLLMNVFGTICKKAARRIRFFAMCFGIGILLLFTGFSASVVRAALMGFLVLIAEQIGRKGNGLVILILSAALMIWFNPKMLLSDLSFQLSFLSTLGLIVIMPILEKIKLPLPDFVREGFLVTLAAMVFTTSLLMLQFGRFSIIAPVANIFVLPLVAPIMFSAFLAIVCSFFLWPLALFFGFITHFLISLMLALTSFFASLPFAAIHF